MSIALDDPALHTLLLPFGEGLLTWPSGDTEVRFLNGRLGAALEHRARPRLRVEQAYRPAAEDWLRRGIDLVQADDETRAPWVWVLPPRQRDAARAMLARAVALVAPGGRVLAAARNDEGARSLQDDLAQLAAPLASLSKHHCRAFWTAPLDAPPDPALCELWRALDAPRELADTGLLTRPGVFAWDRIDAATALLIAQLPNDLVGRAADLGAGLGVLARAAIARNPAVRAFDLYEADARALELARQNLADEAARIALGFFWHDVTRGLHGRYDVIVSNPPFHAQGRAALPELGRRFLAAACDALAPHGRLWLVANRQLPYEDVLAARCASVRQVVQRDGFKVIEAVRGAA